MDICGTGSCNNQVPFEGGFCRSCLSGVSQKRKEMRAEKEREKPALIECKTCNGKLSRNAATCPHCGEPSKPQSNAPSAFRASAGFSQDQQFAYQLKTNKPALFIAVLCMLSMFFPWVGSGPFSISGWNATAFATHFSLLAYLLYLFPIGAATVFYSVINNKPVPTGARLTGLIPFVLTFGGLFKNGIEHLSFSQIIEGYFRYVLPALGVGFWLAVICGFLLFRVQRGSQ